MRGVIVMLLAGVLAAGGCAGAGDPGNVVAPTGAAGQRDSTPAGDGSGPGDGTDGGSGPRAGLVELRVAVDESLAQAFVQVEQGFEAQHPNIEVVLAYGEGLSLADRIAGGEPADVFVTDDPFAARGARLNAEPVEVGRVSLVPVRPGPGDEFVTFVRDGDGRRILIDSGLLRP
ncbi:molybdate ABC transporter substrate-binding protein [Actinoplanes philippinensis]|uniref:molybdate ABC transporter substrate-binding protein n=1 Tax=Actinoplanes philippinensis TaxID=35752 RepID=UPI0033F9F0AB